MSSPNEQDRQDWIGGKDPGAAADAFARQAARGRRELASAEAAADLLGEVDEGLAQRYGKAPGAAAGAGPGARIRSLRRLYAVAAALLLLVAAGYWWATHPAAFSAEAAYADAFTPYANELGGRTMGAAVPIDSATNATLAAGLLAYDRRAYGPAADSLAAYLNPAPAAAPAATVAAARLYYGISLLGAGRTTAAQPVLASLRDHPRYGPPARWYAALAELRLGNLAAARTALDAVVADENSLFRDRARRLRSALPD